MCCLLEFDSIYSMVLFVQLALKYSHTNLDKIRCKSVYSGAFRTDMRYCGLRTVMSRTVYENIEHSFLAAKVQSKRYFDLLVSFIVLIGVSCAPNGSVGFFSR